MVDTQFYEYVSKLLYESGHMITSDPVYFNHSASETLYIDSSKDVAVSRFDRTLLMQISNVSLLLEIKWPGVVDDLTENVHIYSITIDAPDRNRSQIVADTHRLLHQYWDCYHSIVFFKNRNQYLISFANKDQSHILSDWFDINIDYDRIVEKIDIANLSLESSIDYFGDFIYAVARDYYIHPISAEEATYGMIPLTFVASAFGVTTEVSKEDIKAIARANMSAFESQYGDDYVAPVYIGFDEQAQFRRMATELDRISFELELAADAEGEEIIDAFDDDDHDLDLDELDEFGDEWAEDIDPAIFDDPVLMVKWLEHHQSQCSEKSFEHPRATGVTTQTSRTALRHDLEVVAGSRHISEVAIDETERRRTVKSENSANLDLHYDPTHAEGCNNYSAARELSKVASKKRDEAKSKRKEAHRLREEATQLIQDSILAASHLNEKRLELDGLYQKRNDDAAALHDQKRQTAAEKHNEAERLRRIAVSKRQDAIQASGRANRMRSRAELLMQESVTIANRWQEMLLEMDRRRRECLEAECRERKRLEAERREQERLEAERREQERLEAERRERERLEAERRHQEKLRQIHQQKLSELQQKKTDDLSAINSALAAVNMRLKEIEQRLSTLTFLQFVEKRNLKAEQAELIERQANLSKRYGELENKYKVLFAEENRRYEDCVSQVHLQ